MAGYSKRTLIEKLGIRERWRCALLNAPHEYLSTLGALRKGSEWVKPGSNSVDFIQVFSQSRSQLAELLPGLKNHLVPDGMLWVSWPKGSSGMKTDLNENGVREIGLENGLVDVKVCAVDDTWSGLKFVFRVKDRAPLREIPEQARSIRKHRP